MAAEVRAADLPEGSIVARGDRLYAKGVIDEASLPWHQLDLGSPWINYADDDEVQELIADGATVLRHGYGEEQP